MNLDKSDKVKTKVPEPEIGITYAVHNPPSYDNDEDPWIFLKAALVLGVVLGIMAVLMWVGTVLQQYCD
jgi:hypothetical protein